ncbi:Peptidyl-Lys metalloendopeptidase [Leucoagaricus sp. SymC.cos]|nr:Peptidyl-Lys metalloendopeptidase [Leucoagaricus sp. SymC.cos]
MIVEPASEINAADVDFTSLSPGQSVNMNHDLSLSYDFSESGAGTYSIAPHNHFRVRTIGDLGNLTDLYASVQPLTVIISGTLVIGRPSSSMEKRAWFTGCTAAQTNALYSAASEAQIYAASAVDYLQSHTSTTPRYTTWFGEYTAARHDYVLNTYFKLAMNKFYTSFSYYCTCTSTTGRLYVDPKSYGIIYICPNSGFFNSRISNGSYTQAGSLIWAASQFVDNGGAQQHSSAVADTKSLAISDPEKAIRNAISYDFFVENTPSQD